MTCLMWNVCKYICVSLDLASLYLLSTSMKQVWNGYETGLSSGKNLILTFYVKDVGGELPTPQKKNNKR